MRRSVVVGIASVALGPLLVACTLLNSLDYLDSDIDVPIGGDAASGDGADAPLAPPDGSSDGGGVEASVDAAQSYAALVLEDHPFFYLHLSESSGLLAADSSGNGHDGAYVGGVLQSQPGALANDPDRAATFDGTANQYINMQQATGRTGNGAFTMEAWVWPTRGSETPFDNIIDDHMDDGGGAFLYAQSHILKIERTDGVSSPDIAWLQSDLPTDRYTHVVATYDGSTLALYVDGLQVDSKPAGLTTAIATQPMKIGSHFPGSIDEVAYYDHALTSARVRAHHDLGVGLTIDH